MKTSEEVAATTLHLQQLDARLGRLERRNRLLKRGLGLLLGLLGAAVLMGQATSSTVSAQKFLLVDASGKRRAELSMDGGSARFLLLDPQSRARLNLTVQADGQSMLVLYDGDARPRTALSTKADGSQGWVLYDAAQRARATMAMRKDGSPLLFFTNARGKVTTVLPKPGG